jgi:glutamine synthetase
MAADLVSRTRQDGIKFVCLQFTDVVGTIKSVDIPVHRLPEVMRDGIWFDGSSVEGFARIQESDMLLRPDADTYRVLPWSEPERRRARVFCDVFGADGRP